MSTSAEIMKIKFPDKMPVWIEKSSKCALPDIPKNKYLVPKDITFSQLMYVVRKHIKITPSTAIFFNIEGKMPRMCDVVYSYSHLQQEDGLLHITYLAENTFGH
tara:strand:+ start:175 stop:486 length:312 start_codon:yes stop_codon:yes gene_type:complete